MSQNNNSGLPVVPLRYSVPLLVICIVALGILVFVFNLSAPGVYLQAPSNPITTCGQLNQNDGYYTLTANLVFSGGNCLSVIGNNSVVDSNNQYTITGNNNVGDIAVFVVGHNVTLRRLNITDSDIGILVNGANGTNITLSYINNSMRHAVHLNLSSGSKVTQNILSYPNFYGVLLELSSYNTVQNNLVLGREAFGSASVAGIGLSLSWGNSISDNSISNFVFGMGLQFSADNYFTRNIVNGPTYNGIYLFYNNGSANFFNHNRVLNSQKSAIFINNTNETILNNMSVINTNSYYYDLETVTVPTKIKFIDTYLKAYNFNITKAVFRNTGNAWINFTQNLDSSGSNLSSDIRLGVNYVEVNSALRLGLNKPALITFEGLSQNFVNPSILRNGQPCPSNICTALTGLNAGTVVFSVTSWTNYSIGSTSVAPPQMIVINEPDPSDVYSQSNFPVNFDVDLNQTGKAWFSLNNGTTNTSMNTDDNISFNYLHSALSAGNYTFTAYANFTGTTQTSSRFVNFRVTNGTTPPPPGSPTISIDRPDANEIYYLNNFPATFVVDLSQSGRAWFSLNNGVANITMSNSSNSNTHFTYSQSALSAGNYTFTAYANFTGTTQRDTESVNFRVLGNSTILPPLNTTIRLNNTNSSNLPGTGGSVEFKYIAYWLVVAVLSIAVVILILLIVKYFRTRELERNTIPGSIVSQLR